MATLRASEFYNQYPDLISKKMLVNTRFPRHILFFFSAIIFISSCNKINQATDLGDDIIPGVDGVNTFDTTISVDSYNSIFADTEDSVGIGRRESHLMGNISSDPFFGRTNAKMFLELKPEFYKWRFSNVFNKDSLHIDSVVLVLGWQGTYGDTMAMQRVHVYEMDQANNFKIDSNFLIREEYFTSSNLLGSRDFFPSTLNDSIKVYKDTTANQLRIRLNNAFGQRLLNYDTLTAYQSDSAFKTYVRGFEIRPDPAFGNALMTFGLVDEPNTKLAIYYRYDKDGKKDTTVDYFRFTGASAEHCYINRYGFTGTPLQVAANSPGADNLIYLINTPGSYATVKIPALKNISNRIVHRAELIVEQVFDVSDKTFIQPQALYLDVYDSTISQYRAVPYDFVPDQSGVAQKTFGMFGNNALDGSGNTIRKWKFNLTRYVQNMMIKKEVLHNFRLFTHTIIAQNIKLSNETNSGPLVTVPFGINQYLGIGRVRVGGGTHATQRMRLRIVYSKI
jgi:hypothetical protein